MAKAAMVRARAMNREWSLSEMLIWMVLADVVMVLVTVPAETSSNLLIGWAKSDLI